MFLKTKLKTSWWRLSRQRRSFLLLSEHVSSWIFLVFLVWKRTESQNPESWRETDGPPSCNRIVFGRRSCWVKLWRRHIYIPAALSNDLTARNTENCSWLWVIDSLKLRKQQSWVSAGETNQVPTVELNYQPLFSVPLKPKPKINQIKLSPFFIILWIFSKWIFIVWQCIRAIIFKIQYNKRKREFPPKTSEI